MDRFENFSTAIFKISHYWNKLATEEMKEHNLKGTYALYLITLYNSKDEMTAAILSKTCGRDKADVSRAVSTLQKRGLIEPYPKGAYRAPIVLTSEGKKIAEQIHKRAAIALDIAGKGLTEEMRTAMYDSLFLISENLEALSEGGIP